MKNYLFPLILLFGVNSSCAQESTQMKTHFNAKLTVSDSLDDSRDYSGFEILIYSRTNPNLPADTVFFGRTDTLGVITEDILLEREGSFPVQISRNGTGLASLRLILSDKDTINFSGEFPELEKTLSIDSREIRAMDQFERVDNGFKRTNSFIMAGQIADSLIPVEIRKWSDLYWNVFEKQKGSVASKFALENAIILLDRIDQNEMLKTLDKAFEDEEFAFGLGLTIGKEYIASLKGLDEAISYLDSLKRITDNSEIKKAVEQSIIKIYFDSLQVEKSKALLVDYDKKYNRDTEPSFWYKNIRFEMTYLAPGMDVPEYNFVTSEGDSISSTSQLGSTYILEFTMMANQLYQQQYDEAGVIYQLYGPKGLGYFTIPFDQSVNTIIAFYQERDRFWGIAEPSSFNAQDLVDRFNVQYFPSRLLIDKNGKIVRKYVGDEFEDLIPGITKTLLQTN